jgi:hypothetical protein
LNRRAFSLRCGGYLPVFRSRLGDHGIDVTPTALPIPADRGFLTNVASDFYAF